MTNKISLSNTNVVFLIFVFSSIALRFFSFFPSVMDHDESTYMIIGRDLLKGKSMYTEVTDTKPVGIFLFYAGLEFLVGNSIFWKRFIFALIVGITSFLIYCISKKLFKQNKVAFASGIIYIFYTSVWNYHGRSPNTELLFNVFTSLGLLFFLKNNKWNYIVAGLMLGIGFIVKYLVLLDFFAFMLFFFLLEMRESDNIKNPKIWVRYFLAGIAFLIPFALVNLHFWMGDHFSDFFFVTYKLPANYGSNPSVIRYLTMILDFTAKFIPISLLVVYFILNKNKPLEDKHKWFFWIWIVCVLIAIYLPGKELSHYTIQLMLPLSLVAGLFFHPDFIPNRTIGFIYSQKYGWYFLIIIIMALQFIGYREEYLKPDLEKNVANYLVERMDKNDTIFVSNYQQIIYYLTETETPTKFVHTNLLFTENIKAFNVDGNTEVKRIIDSKPRFILIKNKSDIVERLIKDKYLKIKDFDNNKVILYEYMN